MHSRYIFDPITKRADPLDLEFINLQPGKGQNVGRKRNEIGGFREDEVSCSAGVGGFLTCLNFTRREREREAVKGWRER